MQSVFNTVHLAIAFDENYLSPFYALLTSIIKNKAEHTTIAIHAIVSGVSEFEKKKIEQHINQHNISIHFYAIDDKLVNKFVLTSKWTSAVYYRLYFPLIVPSSIKRLVYLDTDTLVLDDLTSIYSAELEHYPVGAVYDNWVKTAPHLGIYRDEEYFNSGVLVIDLEQWNRQQISEKAFAFLQDYPEKIKFVDQDALNAVLLDNWKKLDSRYNFMYSLIPEGLSRGELNQLIKDKVILHFTLQRPWFMLCKNRYRNLYFHYLRLSPAGDRPKIVDLRVNNIPQYIKLRLTELYFDHPGFQKIWRRIKG